MVKTKEAPHAVCRNRLGISACRLVRDGGRRRDRRRGKTPADADGLARLVFKLGRDIKACIEMMSGALWVRDELAAAGWEIEVADARRVKALAPVACKTDTIDARLLAELSRRDLVPALWLPTLDERALRERLRRRMHLVRLRTSAKTRVFGLLTQWGVRLPLARLREADGLELLGSRGVPETWRHSVTEALCLIDYLDERLEPLERELRPLARQDPRVALLQTIPGVGALLGLTIATEVGDIAASSAGEARRLLRAHPAPQAVRPERAHGQLSKSGSRLLRWAAVEASQSAWRKTNPWHRLTWTSRAATASRTLPSRRSPARS